MNEVAAVFDYGSHKLQTVYIDGEPWFCLRDLAMILSYRDTEKLTRRIKPKDIQLTPSRGVNGKQYVMQVTNEGGLWTAIIGSHKKEAEDFKEFVTHTVLPSIRKTGSYSVTPVSAALPEKPIDQVFSPYFNIAMMIGYDQSQAAICAAKATEKITGINVLELMGSQSLISSRQEIFFTPTEIAKELNSRNQNDAKETGQSINNLLEIIDLQYSVKTQHGKKWVLTEEGEKFGRIMDVSIPGKKAPVQHIKWNLDALMEEFTIFE